MRLTCEPMFGKQTRFIDRLADTIDLVIDFATLGEYGLEPAATRGQPECATRRRTAGAVRVAGGDRGDRLPARI
jgi:hypothetical protein